MNDTYSENDTVSRQDAINLVRDVCDAIMSGCESHYDGEDEVYDDIKEVDAILKCNKEIRIALRNMKSAQNVPISNFISRKAAIDQIHQSYNLLEAEDRLKELPSAKPEGKDINVTTTDALISRQAAIDAVNGLIDRFERILSDIRETKVDDSVCGMCEYDGAFIGQSGDWCNECPGFDKDDCFKLSDECRKRWIREANLPSAQPDLSDYSDKLWRAAYERGKKEAMESIVRCGECRHFDEDNGVCKVDGNGGWQADDFCSTGQRREG